MNQAHERDVDDRRCPICGRGVLADMAFDWRGPTKPIKQTAESRQLDTYSCGHRTEGASLASGNAETLDVERRRSEETAEGQSNRRGAGNSRG
jgi:hypothetical protein